jgi:hypothetical protein
MLNPILSRAIRWLVVPVLILLSIAWSARAGAEVAPKPSQATQYAVKAGLPAAKNVDGATVACTYNPATLHGGTVNTVWDGPTGELVKAHNYIQRITSPDCGTSVRAATNWVCTKNGSPANCGAELGHYVEDGSGSDYSITVYSCSTSGYPCFSSSGADGFHSTYSAWFAPWYQAEFRGALSVSWVAVAGRSSNANHLSRSGWLLVSP